MALRYYFWHTKSANEKCSPSLKDFFFQLLETYFYITLSIVKAAQQSDFRDTLLKYFIMLPLIRQCRMVKLRGR